MNKLPVVSSQELDREKYAHSVLQFQFSEMKETLKQSEELLNVSVGVKILLQMKDDGYQENSELSQLSFHTL